MNTLYINGDTCTIFLGLRMHQFYIFIVFDNFLVFRGHSRGILAMVQGGGIIRQWCHIYRSESLSQVQFILFTMLYSFPNINSKILCFIVLSYIYPISHCICKIIFSLYIVAKPQNSAQKSPITTISYIMTPIKNDTLYRARYTYSILCEGDHFPVFICTTYSAR